jgi:hypothetical protein
MKRDITIFFIGILVAILGPVLLGATVQGLTVIATWTTSPLQYFEDVYRTWDSFPLVNRVFACTPIFLLYILLFHKIHTKTNAFSGDLGVDLLFAYIVGVCTITSMLLSYPIPLF